MHLFKHIHAGALYSRPFSTDDPFEDILTRYCSFLFRVCVVLPLLASACKKPITTPQPPLYTSEEPSLSDADYPLFHIGGELGTRAGLCKNGQCPSAQLFLKRCAERIRGAEGRILNAVAIKTRTTDKQPVFLINRKDFSSLITLGSFVSHPLFRETFLLGIPLVLHPHAQALATLTFSVYTTGFNPQPQMQIMQTYPHTDKEECTTTLQKGGIFFSGSLRQTVRLTEKQQALYLILPLTLSDMQKWYTKLATGQHPSITIDATASGYHQKPAVLSVALQ